MISLRRIDHVALRVADVDEAAPRWAIQFGLTERSREDGRALLSCDDEPYALELIEGGQPGHDHTGFELRRSCSLDDAQATTWTPTAWTSRSARAACSSPTPTATACSSCPTGSSRPSSA